MGVIASSYRDLVVSFGLGRRQWSPEYQLTWPPCTGLLYSRLRLEEVDIEVSNCATLVTQVRWNLEQVSFQRYTARLDAAKCLPTILRDASLICLIQLYRGAAMTSVVSATRSEFERVAWSLDISHCPVFSSDSQMYTSYWVLVLGSFVGCAGRWLDHECTSRGRCLAPACALNTMFGGGDLGFNPRQWPANALRHSQGRHRNIGGVDQGPELPEKKAKDRRSHIGSWLFLEFCVPSPLDSLLGLCESGRYGNSVPIIKYHDRVLASFVVDYVVHHPTCGSISQRVGRQLHDAAAAQTTHSSSGIRRDWVLPDCGLPQHL